MEGIEIGIDNPVIIDMEPAVVESKSSDCLENNSQKEKSNKGKDTAVIFCNCVESDYQMALTTLSLPSTSINGPVTPRSEYEECKENEKPIVYENKNFEDDNGMTKDSLTSVDRILDNSCVINTHCDDPNAEQKEVNNCCDSVCENYSVRNICQKDCHQSSQYGVVNAGREAGNSNDELPSYRSLIAFRLMDCPPDYEDVTGIRVNVDEVCKDLPYGRARLRRDVQTCSDLNKSVKRLLMLMATIIVAICVMMIVLTL